MNILLTILGSLFVVGLLTLLWANSHAVEGYEDEEGFHIGNRS